MTVLLAISVIGYILLWGLDTKVFLHQRTIRKISTKYHVPQPMLGCLYPNSYIIIHKVAYSRWLCIGYLLYENWMVAIGLAIGGFLIRIVMPEQDDFANMQKMLNTIENCDEDADLCRTLRKWIGETMYEMDKNLRYDLVGAEIRIQHYSSSRPMEYVKGDILNITHIYKEYNKYPLVVKFEKEIAINNSWPQTSHLLYPKDIDLIRRGVLTSTDIHFVN